MEEKKVYLAWQDPTNRSWYPVGILTSNKAGTFRFVYTEGARSSKNFTPFSGMNDLNAVYESKDLFPLFSNRLLSDSRPEYGQVLQWLGIANANGENIILDMLAVTEGIRVTDTFGVFKCPSKNLAGQYEVAFFSHGLRHISKKATERVNNLTRGDRLYLACDVQNKFDPAAIILRTDDPVELVGYSPHYLSPDFRFLLEKNNPSEVVVTVERINREAPLNLRLFCKLVAPWPDGFQPCSDEKFRPLAEYPYPGEIIINNVRSAEKTVNSYHFGTREEQKVARQIGNRGAAVKVSPASRGAAVVKATFPSGKSWKVQVKSTG